MVDREQLTLFYKQNLENDIIKHIADIKGIDLSMTEKQKDLSIYRVNQAEETVKC